MSEPDSKPVVSSLVKPDRRLEEILHRQVSSALDSIAKPLAVVLVIFGALNFVSEQANPALGWLLVVDLVAASYFVMTATVLSLGRSSTRWAHPLAFGVVVVMLANVVADLALTREPGYLAYLLILIIGCSGVMLSWRWLLVAIGLTVVVSVSVAPGFMPADEFYQYVLAVSAASVLAVILFRARLRAILRTEAALSAARDEAAARREAEAALRAGERRLELAIAGSQGGWWDIEMDPENPEVLLDAIRLDPVVKGFMGFTDDEFPSSIERFTRQILPEDQAAHAAAVADHIAGKTDLFDIEFRVRHKNGGLVWLYTRGRIQHDQEGRPIRWSGISWDITESKRAQERLHLLTLAIEQSPSLVLITSTDGVIEYVNGKFTASTGFTVEEVIGKNPRLLKSDDTPPETHRDLWRTISAGRVWQGELKNTRKDGTSYWVSSTITPIKNADGDILHYLSLQEDITDRRRAEVRLAQSQNLASVGQLVSGVAHDFNNLLTVVVGFSEIGLRQLSEGELFHQEFTEIKRAGEAAGDLTSQLLAFSRQQILHPRVLNLNDLVTDVEELLRRTIREDIELRLDLSSDLGAVKVDPAQLRQILVNLAVNAQDAMAKGGQLSLETRNVELDEGVTFGAAAPEPGSYVLLKVSDTGHGMDQETQARVFEPFFTTKPRAQGAGLGMSAVYGIVKQSGGFISLDSELGVGTTVKIFFPMTLEVHESTEKSAAAVERGGGETILVVEDSPAVRSVAGRTLLGEGYQVLCCAEAEEATRVFSEHEVDLLLTDVVMPGVDGATLARTLREKRPSLRVLLMSGYAERSVLESRGLEERMPFLGKPFRLDELLSKVRACLDDEPEA